MFLVFEIFIFKLEHFSGLFNIWMKIYKEDMFAKIAVATNKEGYGGYPCFTPLSSLKGSEKDPLLIIQLETFL